MGSEFDADFALAADFLAVYGKAVTLRRAEQSQEVTAVAQAESWTSESEDGGTVQWQGRGYLIRAADYQLGGAATEPQRGDLIEETIDGVSCTFELLVSGGEPCWGRTGPDGSDYYLHTKQIE